MTQPNNDDRIIEQALEILTARLRVGERQVAERFEAPEAARRFCILQLAERPHEVFAALFLDSRHRLIEFRELFRGTVDGAAVHPREVVREALALNAAALIVAHNHPSGDPEPSAEDRAATRRLQRAGRLLGVELLDHVVVARDGWCSFLQRGWM